MSNQHTVYLALGSNLGNRAAHLHTALQQMAAYATVEITSFLYETPPAYVTDQPKFLNAVCRVTTSLNPHELLAALEETMKTMGRVRTLRYGPRIIDLDILFFDDLQIDTPDLTIPHPRLPERNFVLEPLCDMAPDLRHPLLGLTMCELLSALRASPLPKVMPVGDQLWYWGQKTYIMGILNITPDSFSGDGLVARGGDVVEHAVRAAQQLIAEGADCLDLGGMSTRPGHTLIPVEEEMSRVIPVIRALAGEVKAPLSIDSFRSEVTQAALGAGAHLVNDIWGLRYDRQLARLAAESAVPLVVMHNRMEPADSAYQTQVQSLPFGPANRYEEVVADIQRELDHSLALAQSLGVPRWHLVVDPGLGFGKTAEQQLELIDRLHELKATGYPLLFGPSRKSFISKVLGGLPRTELLEGTLAACALAIDRGADILRVHDVRAASRAARMADAIVRR